MIVLVDMDGTIADLEGRFVEQYNALYPEYPVGPRTEWDLASDVSPERRESVWAILSKDGFFAGLDPLPGAVDAFRAMHAEGHDVVLCTSPYVESRWCESEKRHWAEQHLGVEAGRSMVITKDKTLVRGDVLIDDKPVIAGRLSPAWRHVLVDQAWNRHVGLPRIARDWSDWREVLAGLR